jgi:hypothetical protein
MIEEARLNRVRKVGPAIVLLAGLAFYATFVNRFYPINTWLFLRYASYWLIIGAWLLGCWSFGYEIVARHCAFLRKTEQLTVGLALGVLAFGLAIFFIGLLHGLYTITALVLPVAFFAVGARRLSRDLRRLVRKTRLARRMSIDLRVLPFWALALLGIAFLYVGVISPETYSYDVRWYHMPIAQRYALSHAVERFDEGLWLAAFPHLLSYIYAWVFLLPKTLLFDRMVLGGHVEFFLFVATLAQIPVVIRRVVPGTKASLAWIAPLAFPKIYLYDSNLNACADHFAGFFLLPAVLLIIRAWRNYERDRVVWAALFIGAIALTKYTAYAMGVVAGGILFMRGAWLLVTRRSVTILATMGALLLVALAISAPHWLKNWVWYGDPIYPQLHSILPAHPWSPEMAARRDLLDSIRRGGEFTRAGLIEALKATVTFSFVPNDWEFFHRDWPIFGSLFTLTLPCLFFLRRSGALWGIYLGSMASVFLWYLLAHYDRYLQAILPAMALGTAACLARIWELGTFARASASLLIGFQIIWGSDVPFIRTHNQIGDSPLRHVAQFLNSGFDRRPGRLTLFQPWPQVAAAVPKDGVLLAHETELILGLERNWVADVDQSLISYGALGSPRAVHEQLRSLGVTHLVWTTNSQSKDTLAGDLVFFGYASRYTEHQQEISGYHVGALPEKAPESSPGGDAAVAVWGCGRLGTSWYSLSELRTPAPRRSKDRKLEPEDANPDAEYAVIDRACHAKVKLGERFRRVGTRGKQELYVRSPSTRRP